MPQAAITVEVMGRYKKDGSDERLWRTLSRGVKSIFHKEDEVPLGLYQRKLEEVALEALREHPDVEAVSAKTSYAVKPLVRHKYVIDEHRIQIEYWAERSSNGMSTAD
jgi:hypothetical protein